MSLPFLPMKKTAIRLTNVDPSINTEARLRIVEENFNQLYDYMQTFIYAFPNATGEALDPTQGEGGDGALEIDQPPSNIVYTPGAGLSVDEVLFGHIDIAFTLPPRAVGVVIKYREASVVNFEVNNTSLSPYRLTSLKVGTTYNIQLAGESANGIIGPYSPLETLTIPLDAVTMKAPADAEYVVALSHDTLTAERVVTDTPTIAWDKMTVGQIKANLVQLYQLLSEKDQPNGYAGLNSVSRTTKGVQTSDYLICTDGTKGLVLRDSQSPQHYWRIFISVTDPAGPLEKEDLGALTEPP